ncbi:methyl-accepting chemotaxis protein [Sporosarcina gallistercoris]|uniref:Methyl-accepting chemotaxis protein n=1 Tax=Sporosarcina gallistercoris TaxID=2762245 RepID=A0ABR8PLH9_9BACL|nr:methyl-accepting chemotaxis protein [Sporosarcina gallistercoris]MBD7909032.1 methyl-accepting chemotaxis protein [Sporosarcina gallistercoris]
MSIGKKLYGGFAIVLIVILLSSLYSFNQIAKIENEYKFLLESRVAQTILAKNIQAASGLEGSYIRSYLLLGKQEDLDKFDEHYETINQSIAGIRQLAKSDKMKGLLDKTEKLNSELYATSQEIVQLKKAGDSERALNLLDSKMSPINNGLRETVTEMTTYQNEQLNIGNENALKTAKNAKLGLLGASVIALVLAGLISTTITRSISKPVIRLSKAVSVVASGNLSDEDIHLKSKDELNDLAKSFNGMKQSLRTLIGGVNDNALHLTASAEELSASTYEVSQSSEEMAKSIDSVAQGAQLSASAASESSIAMDETAVGVQRIAESAAELNDSAEKTKNIAVESGQTIETAKEQMDIIYQSSNQTSELIKRLSRQSEEIESITKVITGITEQTNLLALNAAIEAARAGEHGKGFAVVADEVRKLAEESKKSASQIVELTVAIQTDTKNVEQSVTDSMVNVEQGVHVIENAGRTFLEIVKAVEIMSSQIAEISASTEQISASAEEVSASVNEISGQATSASAQTEQNAAAMEEQMATIEEINAVAQDLSNKAVDLQEMIQQFTV